MLNLVREGEEDYIEAIRYRRRLKIFENFLFYQVKSIFVVNFMLTHTNVTEMIIVYTVAHTLV